MIKKLKSVTNMGVFDGYRWPTGDTLNEFKRFNIVYGSNGSGKTTLSRLFRHLAEGECEPFHDLKYSVETVDGTLKETDSGSKPIRVFNADYVRSNIGEIEGELNPIIIVGKEQKELQAELAANEREFLGRQQKLKELTGRIAEQEKARGKAFTNIASQISLATQGLTSRNYRKPQAESAYAKLTEFKILCDEKLEIQIRTAEQKKLDGIVVIDLASVEANIATIANASAKLLAETVEAMVIPRLKENPQISQWVESGIDLHAPGSHCEFCGNSVAEDRLRALAAHFNDADRSLKEQLQNLVWEYENALQRLQARAMPSKMQLFDEFQEDFESAVESVSEKQEVLTQALCNGKKLVEQKLSCRTEVMSFSVELSTAALADAAVKLNRVLAQHNEKSASFEAARSSASTQIEQHYLSTIQPEIKAYDTELSQLREEEKGAREATPRKGNYPLMNLKLRSGISVERLRILKKLPKN